MCRSLAVLFAAVLVALPLAARADVQAISVSGSFTATGRIANAGAAFCVPIGTMPSIVGVITYAQF
ncbi:MAG: hypothetical protein JWM87_1229 [Candidatus Eremiobacteraeota bacterium]|nr:hypothetical protein [Candidatus Eremiobacteraeota bacterium]